MQACEVGASQGIVSAGGGHKVVGDEGRGIVNHAIIHDGAVAVGQTRLLLQQGGNGRVNHEGRTEVGAIKAGSQVEDGGIGQVGGGDCGGTIHDAVVRAGTIAKHSSLESGGDGG